MKQLMHVCLLAMGLGACAAVAQTTAPAPAPAPDAEARQRDSAAARRDADAAKQDAESGRRDAEAARRDEEKTRAKLEEARMRLDKAARDVAELSNELGRNERREWIFIDSDGGPKRAILGVQVDPQSGTDGARLLGVSPGGPAEEAGLRTGDVIIALDGKSIAGNDRSGRVLVEQMRAVKPEQKVKVRVLRSGKNKDVIVVARPMMFENRVFNVETPDLKQLRAMSSIDAMGGGMPMMREFRGMWPGDFGGLELASITPKLGAYFGASEGVLVVQAPEGAAFKLEDGDVIQSIDGRKPDDGAHALRILRSYKSGEKLNVTVLRQRKPVTLAITMPERPEFNEAFMNVMPPVPPVPPVPPMPPMGGPGTDE